MYEEPGASAIDNYDSTVTVNASGNVGHRSTWGIYKNLFRIRFLQVIHLQQLELLLLMKY